MLCNPKLGDATQGPRLLKVGASLPELAKAGYDYPSGQEANVITMMSLSSRTLSSPPFNLTFTIAQWWAGVVEETGTVRLSIFSRTQSQ